MPPKKADNASKKTVQKKKQQIVEDKTFGLKNKNKSKKVQQQIASVEKSVMNSGDPRQRRLEEQRKQVKADAKLRKKAAEDEQNALFSEALLAVQKKGTIDTKSGKTEALGRDGNDDNTGGDKKGTSRAMKMMFQMDAQEMEDKLREDPNYVPTLEDEIETQRQAKVAELKAANVKGTPVTPESFAIWRNRKRQQKIDANKKLVQAELRKKKGGKGLSILSGRDLFEYKRELFKDREDDDIDGDDNNDNDNNDDNDNIDNGEMESSQQQQQRNMNENGNTSRSHDDTDTNGMNGQQQKSKQQPQLSSISETNANSHNGSNDLAEKMNSELFLQEDDIDIDDLEEDDD